MDDKRIEIKKIHSVTMSTLPNLSSERNFTEINKNRAAMESDISVTEVTKG